MRAYAARRESTSAGALLAALALVLHLTFPITFALALGSGSHERWIEICSSKGPVTIALEDPIEAPAGGPRTLHHCPACPVCPSGHDPGEPVRVASNVIVDAITDAKTKTVDRGLADTHRPALAAMTPLEPRAPPVAP